MVGRRSPPATTAAPRTEGFANVLGFRLFFREWGASTGPVLLGVHGGPGATHDYLVPFADVAADGFRVVLFDQLGCGKSDVPEDHSVFTLEHNVAEVEGLRGALDLGQVHLIGSSYGGLLALAYAIAHGDRLRSLITVGGLADVPFASREMRRLVQTLPPETRETLRRAEAAGDTSSPEYLRAVDTFNRTFLCRLDPWPAEVQYSLAMTTERPVYAEMNGPNEFTIIGSIRDIDVTPQLGRIHVPTLVLGGKHDEVTPRVAEQIRERIPSARRVEFPNSSHMPFWEEREDFHAVLSDFLRGVDEGPRR